MTASARTLLALLLYSAGACGQSWSPDDLWNWHTPRDPRISPDGRRVVYLEEWNDRAADATYSNLWLVSLGDKQPRRLTEGAWQDRSPRWSPDGSRIAWISGRGGIHVLAVDSGKEAAIEAAPLAFAWSRDGQSIAFTARVAERLDPPAWAPAAVLQWVVPQSRANSTLFVVPAAGGPAQAITGPDFDAVGEPAWIRDGPVIAAADGQIYSVHIAGNSVRRLTSDSNRNENPVVSPDGTKVAWTAIESGLHSYSVRKLYVMNADGSRVKPVAGALDRDPENPQWSSDSRTIYFIADDSGATHVYASRNDSTVRQVTQGVERLRGFSLADNGRAVTVRFNGRAMELVSLPVDMPPSTAVVLAAPMTKLMADRETAVPEEIHVPSAGKSIQAWVIKPAHFDASRKYPLLLDIADDPRRMFGPDFSLRAQIFAARGWVVLRVNPRGTPGYGEEFGRLLSTRYPGDDSDDLLAAVDFVVAKGGIDEKRIAVSGGLLAAWILGHSDRFAAVVARRPIVDFTLMAERAAPWMGALPWDNPDRYVKHSPIYFAGNWKTPTLVLAGEHDAQADEFYSALELRKVKSVMVRAQDWSKPSARMLEVETALAWLGSVLGSR
jgi:dipeptidyl aminopeptidase/acylaminoacyl peptidase